MLTIPLWSLSYIDKNVRIFVLKLTLVVWLWVLLFSGWPPLLECPASTFICSILSGKANEDSDYTAIIAGVHWHLCAKTHAGGEVVSTVLASFWLPLLTRLKQHGHYMTCIVSLPHGIIWKASITCYQECGCHFKEEKMYLWQ